MHCAHFFFALLGPHMGFLDLTECAQRINRPLLWRVMIMGPISYFWLIVWQLYMGHCCANNMRWAPRNSAPRSLRIIVLLQGWDLPMHGSAACMHACTCYSARATESKTSFSIERDVSPPLLAGWRRRQHRRLVASVMKPPCLEGLLSIVHSSQETSHKSSKTRHYRTSWHS
jgi:hypothetical protein